MLDLVLPLQCGGCGVASTRWCATCAKELAVRPDEPHLISPRVDPGVPVFSLGRYAGARREAIVAVKEHGQSARVWWDAFRTSGCRVIDNSRTIADSHRSRNTRCCRRYRRPGHRAPAGGNRCASLRIDTLVNNAGLMLERRLSDL